MWQTKKIKVGVVGLGAVAQVNHLPRLIETLGISVVGVTDACEKRTKEIAHLYDVKGYSDYKDLCECEDVDAVFILTPPSSHLDIFEIACENRKHVFCEKPMALNVDEGETMVRKASKAGVVLMVGYMMRFSPDIRLLKRMLPLLKGDLRAQTKYTRSLPPSKATFQYNRRLGGGALFEMGIHHLNLLRWFFGEASPLDVNMQMNGDVDVATTFSLTFVNGVTTHSEVSWISPIQQDLIYVEGKKGHVKVAFPQSRPAKERFVNFNLRNIFREAGDLSIGIRDSSDAYRREIDHFVDCILKDQQPLTSGSDAVEDLRLVSDIYSRGNQIDR